MNEANYKVLITTSGVGQRLGDLTKYTNQSLVRLLKKPILSHIVESYPKDVELVVLKSF
jgi:NDP-sugar pyrophosphorylase family protein